MKVLLHVFLIMTLVSISMIPLGTCGVSTEALDESNKASIESIEALLDTIVTQKYPEISTEAPKSTETPKSTKTPKSTVSTEESIEDLPAYLYTTRRPENDEQVIFNIFGGHIVDTLTKSHNVACPKEQQKNKHGICRERT